MRRISSLILLLLLLVQPGHAAPHAPAEPKAAGTTAEDRAQLGRKAVGRNLWAEYRRRANGHRDFWFEKKESLRETGETTNLFCPSKRLEK